MTYFISSGYMSTNYIKPEGNTRVTGNELKVSGIIYFNGFIFWEEIV